MSCVVRRVFQISLLASCSYFANAETADSAWQNFIDEGAINENIPDFSYSGFFAKYSTINPAAETMFNVLDFGAIPDDDMADNQAIQDAIDAASENGGGIVFLPKGRYQIQGGDAEHILQITSSNIVIRGESDEGDNASILYLENPSDGDVFGLIGQNSNDLRSLSTLSIKGEPDNTELANFAANDYLRGTQIIEVSSTAKLRPHQTIRIQLTDPMVDINSPNPSNNTLVKSVTFPFEFSEQQSSTLGRYGKTFEYVTKVRKIIDDKHIELYQGLRFDHLKEYTPTILAFGGLTNIGIEKIRFESAWLGQYTHHAPYPADAVGSDIIRSEREQDYGWVGIWGTWLSESWLKDVTINNYTENVILSNSAFINLSSIKLQGNGGHAGFTYSSAYNILTKDIDIQGDYVHPLSIRAWTSGCVFSNITIATKAFNPLTKTGPFIDLHGLYPYENLFENLTGFYVHSGGDLNTLPHSGVRNTFWNIQTPELIERFSYAKGEFFNTTATQVNKMYQYYPSSLVVGVYGENGGEVAINRNTLDNTDEFMQIYNLNKNIVPVDSLFEAQVAIRQATSPLLPSPPILLSD